MNHDVLGTLLDRLVGCLVGLRFTLVNLLVQMFEVCAEGCIILQ